MIFGNGSDNKKLIFSKHYSSETGEEEIKGSVKINVGLLSDFIKDHEDLEKNTASFYIKRLEKTYTEWENKWENGQFVEFFK